MRPGKNLRWPLVKVMPRAKTTICKLFEDSREVEFLGTFYVDLGGRAQTPQALGELPELELTVLPPPIPTQVYGPVGYAHAHVYVVRDTPGQWGSFAFCAVFGKDQDVQKFIRKFSAYALMQEALDQAEEEPLEVVAILDDVFEQRQTGYDFCSDATRRLIAQAMAGLDLNAISGIVSADGKRFSKMVNRFGAVMLTGPKEHAVAAVEVKHRVTDHGIYGPRQDVAAFIRRYSKLLTELSLSESASRDRLTILPTIEFPWSVEKPLNFDQSTYPKDLIAYARNAVDAFGLEGELTVARAYWTGKDKSQIYFRSVASAYEPLTALDAAAAVCVKLEYRGTKGLVVYGSLPAVEKFTRLFMRQLAVLQEP